MAGIGDKFFSTTWTVVNFNKYFAIADEEHKSPVFESNINHMSWKLLVRRTEKDIIVLRIADLHIEQTFEVDVELSFLDSDESVLLRREFRNLENTLLLTRCSLQLRRKTTLNNLTVQCKVCKSDGSLPLLSKAMFARTTLESKCVTFDWTIKDFSTLRPSHKATLELKREHRYDPGTLRLEFFSDHGGRLFLKLYFREVLKVHIDSTFKACIIDSTSQSIDSQVDSRVIGYDPFEEQILQFSTPRQTLTTKRNNFLPRDVLSIRCEINMKSTPIYTVENNHLSDHDFTSEEHTHIEKTSYQISEYDPEEKSSFANDALKELFEDKTFCDYTLCAGSKSFPVHRAVLCSRSTVFRAMFNADMREARGDTMDLPNLDADTLNRFLLFLYTEELDAGLDWEDAYRLYSVADQYEVRSLSQRCRSLLKCRVTNANACEILILADAHDDEDLKEELKNYIAAHSKEIISSSEWKRLTSENEFLANQVMTDLNLKRSKKRKAQT